MKSNILILILCLLGSILRITYAVLVEPWNEAPDHLAWEIVLNQNQWHYRYLIHYPHEGGSILVSLIAKFFSIFSNNHLLSNATLFIDFIVRLAQLLIVKSLWGRRVATLFGIWSIFTISALLPWSSVNYGLHYLSSIFPFVFLWLIKQRKEIWLGVFLGVSVWLHYSNLILFVVFLFYVLFFESKNRKNYLSLLIGIVIILLHWAVKNIFDPAFHFLELNSTSIRGLDFSNINPDGISNFYTFFTTNLKLIYFSGQPRFILLFGYIWLFSIIGGIGLFIINLRKIDGVKISFTALLTLIIFLIIYSASPLFPSGDYNYNYVEHRHVTYILPLFILLSVIGFQSIRFKVLRFSFFSILMIVSITSIALSFRKEKAVLAEKATGWVLGTKFGHQVEELKRIIEDSNYAKEELTEGAFWGVTSSIFKDCEDLSENEIDERKKYLLKLIENYSDDHQIPIKGVEFALNKNVTPIICDSARKKLLTSISNLKKATHD